MYCIHCGVELSDSETVCPLCGTRVFHPDLPRQQGEPPFPPEPSAHPEEVNRSGALFILTMLAVLPIVICILCDWSLNGTIVWSGFASGGVLLLYILAVLPLWFKRPDPVVFVPVDFAAIGVYLLYIDLASVQKGSYIILPAVAGDRLDRHGQTVAHAAAVLRRCCEVPGRRGRFHALIRAVYQHGVRIFQRLTHR